MGISPAMKIFWIYSRDGEKMVRVPLIILRNLPETTRYCPLRTDSPPKFYILPTTTSPRPSVYVCLHHKPILDVYCPLSQNCAKLPRIFSSVSPSRVKDALGKNLACLRTHKTYGESIKGPRRDGMGRDGTGRGGAGRSLPM